MHVYMGACVYVRMCVSVYAHPYMHVHLAAQMWRVECAAQPTDYQYKGKGSWEMREMGAP